MGFATKVAYRLTDPVFYRKQFRRILRSFQQFDDAPLLIGQDDLKAIENALIVVAHPDDETFCSGLISALNAQGTKITLICLTRGEGGPTGGSKREELGSVREKEMHSSCAALGVDELVFLDHVDPVGGAYRVYAPEVSVDQLADEIEVYANDADLIISHGSSGEYWHAAHLLVHAAVRKVVRGGRVRDQSWITFCARNSDHVLPHLINEDDEADFRYDASDFHQKRLDALIAHQSQLGLFQRFAGGSIDDFVKSTSSESYCVQAGDVAGIINRESD